MTEDELAEATGKTVRTIRRRADDGVIVRGPDGLYDLEVAASQIRAASTGAGRRKAVADARDVEGGSPAKVRRAVDWNEQLKREQARKARLERRELQGQLVRRGSSVATWAGVVGLIRDQMMQIMPRMCDRFAVETSPAVILQIGQPEVIAAMKAVSVDGLELASRRDKIRAIAAIIGAVFGADSIEVRTALRALAGGG